MPIHKAVITAAGLGTRVLPATKAVPKEMLPVADTPTIQYIAEEAAASGITSITFITSRTKRAVEDHFDDQPELREVLERKGDVEKLAKINEPTELAHFSFVRQPTPLGLGHAVLMARRVYLTDLDAFDAVLTREGGDLRRAVSTIIQAAKKDRKDPFGAVKALTDT